MQNLLKQFADFLLPRYCTGCNQKLNIEEKAVCEQCMQSIRIIDLERIENEYDRKFKDSGIIKDFLSLYVFEAEGTLQQIIHSVKYNKKFLAGKLLGEKLAVAFGQQFKSWKIDCIIPIPIHHLKKAERGYNQSDYIATGLKKALKLPALLRTVKRIRYTQSQTSLNSEEREENVAGAFKVRNKNVIFDKNILLIDDVITTGATIRECGREILEGGAKSVYACSVAITD